MALFDAVAILSTLLVSLVAGFLFAFAVVVMPGIRSLHDGPYLRAFQVMDSVIQDNRAAFMVVWVGSVVAVLACVALATGRLAGADLYLLILTGGLYLVGVQLPTVVINIPLNNQIQQLDVNSMTEEDRRAAREAFERRWNRSNVVRTYLSILTAALLIFIVFRL